MPVVDRGAELHARVGTLPGGLGDLTEEVASLDGLDRLTRRAGDKLPIGVVDDGLHELVSNPDRVVGILILDGVNIGAVEAHIEPGDFEGPRLTLFERLAPDELLNIGVIGVEDDHLGGTAGLAPRLDGASRRIGTAHEADRPARSAATVERLLTRSDVRQVDAGARAALENSALLGVPVEDRVQVVVDPQDEARRCLLRNTLDADVEPHRRVECSLLGDEQMGQLGAKCLGFSVIDEVAVTAAPGGDGADDTVDHLAQRAFTFGRTERSAEVLLGKNVGCILRPVGGNLDAELFEGDRAVAVVGQASVAPFPRDVVVRIASHGREPSSHPETGVLWSDRHGD